MGTGLTTREWCPMLDVLDSGLVEEWQRLGIKCDVCIGIDVLTVWDFPVGGIKRLFGTTRECLM